MVELILTEKHNPGQSCKHISLDTFYAIIDILKRDQFFQIALRVDFTCMHPEFSEIIHFLNKYFFEVIVYLHDLSGVKAPTIELLFENNAQIILPFSLLSAPLEQSKNYKLLHEYLFEKSEHTCIFLPLATPYQDINIISDTLGKISSNKSVLIGAGWKGYYSGPSRLDKSESEQWFEVIHSLLSQLMDQNKSAIFMCGFPLCFFPTEKLGKIARLQKDWPISHCRPEPLINTDGDVALCAKAGFPVNMNVLKESSLLKISNEQYEKIKHFSEFCDFSEDLTCQFHKIGSCGGMCLREAISCWKSYKK